LHASRKSNKANGPPVTVERNALKDVCVGNVDVQFKQVWNNQHFPRYVREVVHDGHRLARGTGGLLAVVTSFFNRRVEDNELNKHFGWSCKGLALQPEVDGQFPGFANTLWASYATAIRREIRTPISKPFVRIANQTCWIALTIWPVAGRHT
jgi:hypothetical protein